MFTENTAFLDFPWDSLNWLIVNEGELHSLSSAFHVGPGRNPPPEDQRFFPLFRMDRLSSKLGEKNQVNIICTLGANGIAVVNGMEAFILPAARLLGGLKDTTGAGDCFTGYFAAGLARPGGIVKTLEMALTVSDLLASCGWH